MGQEASVWLFMANLAICLNCLPNG